MECSGKRSATRLWLGTERRQGNLWPCSLTNPRLCLNRFRRKAQRRRRSAPPAPHDFGPHTFMISLLEPTAGKAGARLYHLEIALEGIVPPIWRRLQVPGSANLGWLHAVIQVAMGWTNSHLHQFKLDGKYYSDPRHHFAEYEGDPEILDERKFTLQQLAPRVKNTLGYEYDFGDSWEHELTVAKILPPDDDADTTALCLDGARACPPEDCGSTGGYTNLLKILKNRKHPEHKTMKGWLGRPFDAEAFDLAHTNLWLRKLKWPRVTEAQLRQVLMGRDNYHD
jgi:hypothetical protein